MGLGTPPFNVPNYPLRLNAAAQSLTQHQADFVSVAVGRAADDACAAMAHQLSEPLTALLLYLHEIKKRCEPSVGVEKLPVSILHMADLALRATERTCEIMERVGHPIEPPTDDQAGVARGSQAIESWKRTGRAGGGLSPTLLRASSHPLTSREREVLLVITHGASNKAGGRQLGISPRTFEAHRAHLMRKLGARNVADLVRIALIDGQ
jgi:DNA-binding CsgD family transcriptional regulator